MTDPAVQRLEIELAEIEKKLSDLDLYQDYKALKRIIRRLRSRDDDERPLGSRDDDERLLGRDEAMPMTSTAGNPATMKNAVVEVLKGRASPMATKDIYDWISDHGVEVPGENPTNNLSAHMSRDPRFLSWGRAGWTLTSAIDPDLTEVQGIAADFLASLDDEARQPLLHSISEGRGLTSELDGELLRFARQRMGRHLVNEEKRSLREKIVADGSARERGEGGEA
ncbi:hypothetical protein [Paracoccus marinus]|uniref:hypothetical protein n=1 Tax=Paracoccus marinus TaxID=288426 RepID=UPI001038B894|nr:hypothetical protein [Paracoccus marinus]